MKFGTVPLDVLERGSFLLPPDAEISRKVLSGKRAEQTGIWLGASSWGDKSWVGDLYPTPTPATKFRAQYPLHFNAIELNATHYTVYDADTMARWAEPARGCDFRFCPKFPQSISHYSGFRNVGDITTAFLDSVRALGPEHLGPIFLQLSENYAPSRRKELFDYLSTLPRDLCFFLEVRHPDWFALDGEREALLTTLTELGMGLVLTDTPGRRDLVHMSLTVPKVMLRFVCHQLHPTSISRSNEWGLRLQDWLSRGLEDAYVFLHPGEEAAVPGLYRHWHRMLLPDRPLNSAPVQGGLF
jgi:uncharacterized protein YecE (DUF72 family)